MDPDDSHSPITAGDQDNLMSLMGSLIGAASASVTVYRVIKNKPLAYVFECSPDSFSMDQLRDEYGGGEFRVYIHKDGDLYRNVRVMVEPKARGGSSDADAALALVRDEMSKQGKLIEALILRQQAPQQAPSLGSMLGQMDLPAVITAFGTLVQMMRPPAPPPMQAPAFDASAGLDMLMKGIQLAKDLRDDSGGGGESSMMDVVRDLIKSPVWRTRSKPQRRSRCRPPVRPSSGRRCPNRGRRRRPLSFRPLSFRPRRRPHRQPLKRRCRIGYKAHKT
jgi:hypothetical protein